MKCRACPQPNCKDRVHGGGCNPKQGPYFYDERESTRDGKMLKRRGERCVIADVYQDFDEVIRLLNCDELKAWAERAKSLVDTLNAYDGAGIPRSDARDAFKFLRELAALKGGK